MLEEEDIPGAKLSKSMRERSVLELKRWLECHGEKKSGKKEELIVRVEGCMAIKKSVDPKVDGGKWYDIKCSGSSQGNGEKFANENLVWNNFPMINIPAVFNEGHIYRYLIEEVDEVLLPGDGDVCVDNATSKSKRKGENVAI